MKSIWIRAALLSCAALAVGPAMAGHSWGNYHWARTSNPLKLDVMKANSSQWDDSVNTAIGDWNQSTKLELTGKAASGVDPKKCTAITGKVLVCNSAYGRRGWLGIATIWASGNHITKATTKLNDSYHNYSPYNSPAWRALVACQEIGHDFGLGHQDEGFGPPNLGTCMDYTNDPTGAGAYLKANVAPNAHDYAQLDLIYQHTDTTNTSVTQATNFGVRVPGQAPATAPGLSDVPGDSPADWGRAIHVDGQGRPDIFVMDLGGGNRKITHVLWVPGEQRGSEHHHDDH